MATLLNGLASKCSSLYTWILSGCWSLSFSTIALAQITGDATLGPTPSFVTPNVTIRGAQADRVDGGVLRGVNLFHSFSQFNVNLNQRVYFDNPGGVQVIISRVTGSNPSNILGTLGVDGTANLFLINPQGIIFGSNARLDIAGAFIATTADRLIFADGSDYSATNPKAPPMLTVNLTPGVQYGASKTAIATAAGAQLTTGGDLTLVADQLNLQGQLQAGGNLTLVGTRSLQTQGATLSVSSSSTTLGNIALTSQGAMVLDNTRITATKTATHQGSGGDIAIKADTLTISNRSNISASTQGAAPGGSVELNARQIQLQNASVLRAVTRNRGSGGNLTIRASESATLSGSLVAVETFSTGKAGNLEIFAPTLNVEATKVTTTLSNPPGQTITFGEAGNILVNANQINVSGQFVNFPSPDRASGFFAGSVVPQLPAGNVIIQPFSGGDLAINLREGSQISVQGGRGPNGGDIILQSPGSITLNGGLITATTNGLQPGGRVVLQTGTLEVQGTRIFAQTRGVASGGDIVIQGQSATFSQGATLSTTTLQSGSAGNIYITLSDRLTLSDSGTLISAGTESGSTGNGGNIWIDPQVVLIQNGAGITVNSLGSGTGGEIQLYAGDLTLNNNAFITAETTSSDGGNLFLQVDNLLLMRNQSLISATAGGSGNGGNITIKAGLVVAVPSENSDIRANAVFGRGGNLQITSQGIFGLTFRPFLTPFSDITANSQFGADGTVTLITPDIDLNRGLMILPSELLDVSEQIAQGCQTDKKARFVVSGRGGLPPNPTEMLNSTIVWQDPKFYASDAARSLVLSSSGNHPVPQETGAIIRGTTPFCPKAG